MGDVVLLEYPVPVLVTRQTGVLSLKARWAEAREVLARGDALGCHRILVDYRQAHVFEDDPEDAGGFVDFVVGQLAGRNARIAGVVRFDHQVDPTVERMVAARGIVFRRFDDFSAALEWLQSDRPADESADAVDEDRQPADAPHAAFDPVSIAARAAADAPALSHAQFALVVHLVADLLAEGLDEARIQPLARRMAVSLVRTPEATAPDARRTGRPDVAAGQPGSRPGTPPGPR